MPASKTRAPSVDVATGRPNRGARCRLRGRSNLALDAAIGVLDLDHGVGALGHRGSGHDLDAWPALHVEPTAACPAATSPISIQHRTGLGDIGADAPHTRPWPSWEREARHSAQPRPSARTRPESFPDRDRLAMPAARPSAGPRRGPPPGSSRPGRPSSHVDELGAELVLSQAQPTPRGARAGCRRRGGRARRRSRGAVPALPNSSMASVSWISPPLPGAVFSRIAEDLRGEQITTDEARAARVPLPLRASPRLRRASDSSASTGEVGTTTP